VIQSGKWDEAKVKQQLAAFGQLDQQVRYYRVKYYFGVNQVLTPEQRTQVKRSPASAELIANPPAMAGFSLQDRITRDRTKNEPL
jgi:hypothetical protein